MNSSLRIPVWALVLLVMAGSLVTYVPGFAVWFSLALAVIVARLVEALISGANATAYLGWLVWGVVLLIVLGALSLYLPTVPLWLAVVAGLVVARLVELKVVAQEVVPTPAPARQH